MIPDHEKVHQIPKLVCFQKPTPRATRDAAKVAGVTEGNQLLDQMFFNRVEYLSFIEAVPIWTSTHEL